ncbi:MAG: DNA polymerase II, partial [Deltaproteobacteria bacterium]|nr:DNA polymerase II [Deltaproteobacteria bacterium]
FHLMLLNGPKLEKRQLQLMRIVDIATDLFALSAAVGRARALGEGKELADLFAREAKERIGASFRAIRRNTDTPTRRLARHVLAGDAKWIEKESV